MRQILAAAVMISGMALPAHATEWMDCGDGENKASFRVLLGAMQVIAPNTVEIEAAGRKWSTAGGDGVTRITVGQAFETTDQIWMDITDENVDRIVARLRLFKAVDDSPGVQDGMATGGTLHLPDVGTWAVSCSGP